ncbi:MAG TPA: 16S rRNA (cytosine(1402)-N(4))-methyltransferase [Planctomycetaceae bacterium]|nr:16S rRNA (cytosine(1402)-N(4))-methyltransferase [Planctomycetaceae bacterium]
MPAEVVQWLQPQTCQTLMDGTFGAGGHSVALARAMPEGGRVVAVDRDPAAVEVAADSVAGLPINVFCHSYHRIDRILADAGVESVDGVVLDLGLSSDQLADRDRGFSFTGEGFLDLRFDPTSGQSAAEFLASSTEKDIADTIYQFGEERFSRRIAKQIVERRKQRNSVRTVPDLVDICRRCVPRAKNHDIHPATRTFQALRIAVNQELAILTDALKRLPAFIKPGGRIAIISFHSLEDRIVKQAFRDDERLEVLTRKPLRPTDAEVAENPRSRSAKMRVAQVLPKDELR